MSLSLNKTRDMIILKIKVDSLFYVFNSFVRAQPLRSYAKFRAFTDKKIALPCNHRCEFKSHVGGPPYYP